MRVSKEHNRDLVATKVGSFFKDTLNHRYNWYRSSELGAEIKWCAHCKVLIKIIIFIALIIYKGVIKGVGNSIIIYALIDFEHGEKWCIFHEHFKF